MSRGAGSSARAGRRRAASFAVAFAALALLLLTPVCDAVAAQAAHSHDGAAAAQPTGHAGDGDHDSPGCCSTIEGSTLLNPASPLIDGGPGEGWNAALPSFARALGALRLPRHDAIRGAVLPGKPFYARSARIRQ